MSRHEVEGHGHIHSISRLENPVGNPKRSDWSFTEEAVGEPAAGGVLVGGSVGDDGSVLLFGANGRVMKADLESGALNRLSLPTNINMNMGLAAADGLIVVGTSGVQHFALPN